METILDQECRHAHALLVEPLASSLALAPAEEEALTADIAAALERAVFFMPVPSSFRVRV